jgi:hypothetical protein
MKTVSILKSVSLLALTSLTLAAATSQADNGYYGGAQNPNPWYGTPPNANPWMANPAYQQARIIVTLKQRQEQLDQRQDQQMLRILTGMESGQLTSREAAGLLRENLAIASLERRYVVDGRLGPNELSSLEQRLAEAERHVVLELHDRERTPPIGHPGDMGRPGEYDRR